MHHMFRLLLPALLGMIGLPALAQSFFGIGYSGTYYLRSMRNLQVEAFRLNELAHPYWTEQLEVGRQAHGPAFDYHFMLSDEFGMFVYWKNHHAVYKAGGVNPVTGFNETMELKVRLNTFGLLGFEGWGEHFGAGFSLDLGSGKLMQRFATAENPDPDWELFYDKSNGIFSNYMVAGHSVFLHYRTGRIRMSFQWFYDWYGIDPFRRESETQYYYRFNNLSFGLHLDLGKRD